MNIQFFRAVTLVSFLLCALSPLTASAASSTLSIDGLTVTDFSSATSDIYVGDQVQFDLQATIISSNPGESIVADPFSFSVIASDSTPPLFTFETLSTIGNVTTVDLISSFIFSNAGPVDIAIAGAFNGLWNTITSTDVYSTQYKYKTGSNTFVEVPAKYTSANLPAGYSYVGLVNTLSTKSVTAQLSEGFNVSAVGTVLVLDAQNTPIVSVPEPTIFISMLVGLLGLVTYRNKFVA